MKNIMLGFLLYTAIGHGMETPKKEERPELNRTESQCREDAFFNPLLKPFKEQLPDVLEQLPDTDETVTGKEKKPIRYAGQEERLSKHFENSLNDPNYPFSVTLMFRFRKELQKNGKIKKIFTRVGDIQDFKQLDDKLQIKDLIKEDIKNNIWIYVPKAMTKKTRLSKEESVIISALIIGTTDTKKVQSLRTLLDQELRKYKEKSQQKETP